MDVALILNFAKEIMFDNSDDEEDYDKNILPKSENYAEEIVPRMQHRQFQQHFRLNIETFEDLLYKLHLLVTPGTTNKCGQPEIPIEKQTMVTIWCLANPECFRYVADRFQISKSTCWSTLYKTCSKMLKLNKKFKIIIWPSQERSNDIAIAFEARSNFTDIIGAIDGSHIPIKAPDLTGSPYVCRKGFHSLLLQATCDHKLLFTDCYAGEAGSIHDSLLFRRSDLSTRIRNREISFYDDMHLVGDGAYALSTTLMKPFKNNGYLTGRQRSYNKSLSKARVAIEMAFGWLKGRFRRLKFLDTKRMDLASLVLIITACILHNICILKGDNFMTDVENIEFENKEAENDLEDEDEDEPPATRRAAKAKRENIMNALPMLDVL